VFAAAIFTNLTRDHLDYHKTFEAYFAAKARLVAYLAPDGLAVVNADDAAWAKLPRAPRRITFGERGKADVTAADVVADARGARFTLVTSAGRHAVALPLLGRFNVANALGVRSLRGGARRASGRGRRAALHRAASARPDGAHRRRPVHGAARPTRTRPNALERALETTGTSRPRRPGNCRIWCRR